MLARNVAPSCWQGQLVLSGQLKAGEAWCFSVVRLGYKPFLPLGLVSDASLLRVSSFLDSSLVLLVTDRCQALSLKG